MLINYRLVGPHYQITFNLQARPAQGMYFFSPLCALNDDLLTFFDICSHVEGGWGRRKGSVTSGLFAHRQEYMVGRPKLSAHLKGKCIKGKCSPCIVLVLCSMEEKLHRHKSQTDRSLPDIIWRCCGAWELAPH